MSAVNNVGITSGELVGILIGEIPAGLVNGVNKVFTTTRSYQPTSTRMYRNGVLQINPDEYTESADKQITFVDPPKPGDPLFVNYIRA